MSKFIESPCDLGDIVYEVMRANSSDPYIIESICCAIHVADGSRNSCQHKRETYIVTKFKNTNHTKRYSTNLLGKKIFLDYEEALKAMGG